MDMTPIAASAFAGLLERTTGQQLVPGRRWRIEAALGPLMRAEGIESLDRLAAAVGGDATSPLATKVVEALLNNETSFFRDCAATQKSHSIALLKLIARREAEGSKRLRIWSAACSTGQEAYSFAIGLQRLSARIGDWSIRILGTDISGTAIAQAREGLYSQMEVQRGLPIRDLLTNFDQQGDAWRAAPALRAQVTFMRHNIFDPPPQTEFDIIMCRNVLLYFNDAQRRQVLASLADAMAPDGFLMLGAGETVFGASDAFVTDDDSRGIYRKASAA